MELEVLLALILGSIFHATWNLYSRAYRDRPGFLWSIIFWSILLSIFVLPFTYNSITWNMEILLYASISGIGLAVYYKYVRLSYNTGEISLMYPVIRSSPLWVSLIGVIFLKESISFAAWLGISIVICGIFVLSVRGFHPKKILPQLRGIKKQIYLPVLASMGTTIYSISDKLAMSWAHSPKAGLAFLSLSGTISLFFWYLIDRPAYTGFSMRKLRISSLPFSQVIFFGFCAFAAYAITISAMGYAGAGKVLAVTNLSLLFGSLGGILFFNERSYLLNRVAGLILLVIGITLIKFF